MIEAKICSNGNEKKIETRVVGSRRDICLETAYLIRSLYEGLLKSSPSEAEYFRGYLCYEASDDAETVVVHYAGGGTVQVDVTADSLVALSMDVLKAVS